MYDGEVDEWLITPAIQFQFPKEMICMNKNLLETPLSPSKPFRVHRKETWESAEWENIHAHHGLELLFVHRGCGTIMIENRLFPIKDHTLIIIQPFQLHKLKLTINEKQPYVRTVFMFEPIGMERYLSPFTALHELLKYLWKQELDNPVLEDEEGSDIQVFFANVDGKDHADEEEQALLLLTLLKMMKKREEMYNSRKSYKQRMRIVHHTERIMEYIRRNYREEIKLYQIADELHLSEPYISRVFHKYTGTTVMEYANAMRLREACLLLAATSLSVKEIGAQIGVSSTSYLCQLFRKHYQITPVTYRQAYREHQVEPVDDREHFNQRRRMNLGDYGVTRDDLPLLSAPNYEGYVRERQ
jgi:AraC family transcriptional regulator of arabinose operon